MTQSRQEIIERRRQRQKQQRLTTILVVVGAALVVAALLMIPAITNAITPVGEFNKPPLNPRPMSDGNAMGDPNAPVTMEIYSDFGCGHCANFAFETGERLTEEYVASGELYVVYNSVGSLMGHPNTQFATEAAYCAGDQDAFWQYHDLVFANQVALFSNRNADIEKTLLAYADYLALDVDAFETCLDDGKYRDQVQQDGVDATQAGINSTPSFVINGQLLVGNRPLEEFRATINEKLAELGY